MNGETSIRPYRIGTSSGTRLLACSSSSAIGSGRFAAGSQPLWLLRGTSLRAALPRALRSAGERWAILRAGGVVSWDDEPLLGTISCRLMGLLASWPWCRA